MSNEKTEAQKKAAELKAAREKQKADEAAAKAAALANRPKRERIASVALPPYSIKKIETGDSIFVTLLSEIETKKNIDHETGEVVKQTKGPKKGEDAVLNLVHVRDMDSGQEGEMVLPFIMHKGLAELAEKTGPLTGRSFEMLKGEAESNKATKWTVYEVKA